MNIILSPRPLFQRNGIALIRIVIASFLICHDKEVFDPGKMKEYTNWDQFKTSHFMPYFGKGSEFFTGLLLLLGLFNRLNCAIIFCTFCYITFFVGSGKFWMDDQYPLLFALFALIFIFTGPGNFALDNSIFKKT